MLKVLLMPILYGGSLNNKNCDEIFNIHEVDGGLVEASLVPETFIYNYQSK